MNLNKVQIAGNLTKDVELRYTGSGKAVADLSIAINEGYGDKKQTTFLDVTVWDKSAETIAQYCKKGSGLYLEGKITVDSWQDDSGNKRYKTKVTAFSFQFLDSKGSAGQAKSNQQRQGVNADTGAMVNDGFGADTSEIPF